MAIDYGTLKKQVDTPPTINSFGMDTISSALNQKSVAAGAINGEDDISGMIKGNLGRTQKAEDTYKSETDPLYKEFDKQASSPHPDRPQYEDVMSYQDLMKSIQDGKKGARDWAAGASILSALIGGVSKKHSMAGLSALKGAMEGIKEGNEASVKQQIDLFNESNKAIKQHNDMLYQQYSDVMADRKLSLDEIKEKITEKAYQFNDLLTAQKIQSGDIKGLTDFLKERDKKVASLQPLAETVTDSSGKILESSALAGDEFLAFLKKSNPKAEAMISEIKAIGDYKQQPRVSRAGSKVDPQAEAIMDAVHKYNRDYDQKEWMRRSAKGASAGHALGRSEVPTKIGDTEVAVQKVQNHIKVLNDRFSQLGNGNIQLANKLGNETAEQLGEPAISAFRNDAQAVANEFNKVFVPNGGAESDRQERLKALSDAKSPAQFKAVTDDMYKLMKGQLDAIKQVTGNIGNESSLGVLDAETPGNAPAPNPIKDPLGIR